MKLSVGSWVAYSEDGIWYSPFDFGKIVFNRKRDIIFDIGAACLDARKSPFVKRVREGKYYYCVKDCDTGRFSREFRIVKVDHTNIETIQKDIDELLELQDGD